MSDNEQKWWAKVEVLGHQQAWGLVTEVTVAGVKFLRVDIPGEGYDPQLIHPNSVFRMTLTTEEVVRERAGMSTSTIPAASIPWAVVGALEEGEVIDASFDDEPEYDEEPCDDESRLSW